MRFYPVIAVGMLAITDAFVNQALNVLAPDITGSLGVSTGALTSLLAIQLLAVGVAPFLMSALVRGRPIRAAVSIVTGFAWSAATFAIAFAGDLWTLGALLLVSGLANGSQIALHSPLLADLYPPAVRGRVLALYGAAMPAGAVLSPLTVSALTGWLGLDWRAVYTVLGVLSMLGCLSAVRLRDPGIGRYDEVPTGRGGLLRSRTLRRVFAAFVAYGMLLVPAATFLSVHLKERWGLDTDVRGLFTACCSAGAVVVLVTLGRRLDPIFQSDARRVPAVVAWVMACSAAAFAAGALAPALPLTLAAFFVGLVLTPLIVPMITLIMVAVTAPAGRSYTASLFGVGLAVGGLAGAALLSTVEKAYGTAGAITSIVLPGLAAGLIIASTARTIRNDLIPVREESVNV
ncbi:MFS transporter [Streptosporangium sp. NPDC051022]|uniref:MFS transporter n=1 Tax=Streptosporangium sp. NPDC051022 TaxID=3155752 RepID=UPI0034292A5B